MATSVWKKLGSPDLSPFTITLHAWDGHPSQPLVLYRNFTVIVAGNTVSIDIEVIDAPLDYNILLGHSYTYAMSVVTYAVHCKMCFPHNRKIIIIDQLTYLLVTDKITHFHSPLPIPFYPFHSFYEINLYLKTKKLY